MSARHPTMATATTRGCVRPQDAGQQSAGEWLLRVGRQAARCIRHHESGDLSMASQELAISERLGALAIIFAEAPDVLKLRALVEDWSMLRILFELRRFFASATAMPNWSETSAMTSCGETPAAIGSSSPVSSAPGATSTLIPQGSRTSAAPRATFGSEHPKDKAAGNDHGRWTLGNERGRLQFMGGTDTTKVVSVPPSRFSTLNATSDDHQSPALRPRCRPPGQVRATKQT